MGNYLIYGTGPTAFLAYNVLALKHNVVGFIGPVSENGAASELAASPVYRDIMEIPAATLAQTEAIIVAANNKKAARRISKRLAGRVGQLRLETVYDRGYLQEAALLRQAANNYIYLANLGEWRKPRFRSINERAVEFGFLFKWLPRLAATETLEVLDVGSGLSALPQVMANCGYNVTAIDNIKDYWRGASFNRHYHILKDDITSPHISRQFDVITCISVIEHIPDHPKAVSQMFRLLKPGGHLIITCPYNEQLYVKNIYKHPQAGYGKKAGYVCQIFSRREIVAWVSENHGELIAQEYYEIFTGELWTFGKRLYPPRNAAKEGKHHLTCLLLKKP